MSEYGYDIVLLHKNICLPTCEASFHGLKWNILGTDICLRLVIFFSSAGSRPSPSPEGHRAVQRKAQPEVPQCL